jgi:hypothetical protein
MTLLITGGSLRLDYTERRMKRVLLVAMHQLRKHELGESPTSAQHCPIDDPGTQSRDCS